MQTVKEAANHAAESVKGAAEKLTGNNEQKQEQEKVEQKDSIEQPGETGAVQEAVAGLEDAKEKKRKYGDVLGKEPAEDKLPDEADEKVVEKASADKGGLEELERLERNVEKENEASQGELEILGEKNENKRAKPSEKAQDSDQV
jgi:hypothetical protein